MLFTDLKADTLAAALASARSASAFPTCFLPRALRSRARALLHFFFFLFLSSLFLFLSIVRNDLQGRIPGRLGARVSSTGST